MDCTNLDKSPSSTYPPRTWKKIAHESGTVSSNFIALSNNRFIDIEMANPNGGKKMLHGLT